MFKKILISQIIFSQTGHGNISDPACSSWMPSRGGVYLPCPRTCYAFVTASTNSMCWKCCHMGWVRKAVLTWLSISQDTCPGEPATTMWGSSGHLNNRWQMTLMSGPVREQGFLWLCTPAFQISSWNPRRHWTDTSHPHGADPHSFPDPQNNKWLFMPQSFRDNLLCGCCRLFRLL